MSVRNNFKKSVLRRIVDELPDGSKICLPNRPTEPFIKEEEWYQVFFQHATSRVRSIGGKGNNTYSRTGTIIIRAHLKAGVGDKRSDEVAIMLQDIFEGRSMVGFSVRFSPIQIREAGTDDDGRYNILLCEVVFEYMEKK